MNVRWIHSTSLLIVLGLAGVACAGHGGEAFTDPAKAGPDFQIQGEYLGDMKEGDQTKPVGVQVIALGKGAFDATLFVGGLPGNGWSRGDSKESAKGNTTDAGTVLTAKEWKATIKDGVMTVTNSGGDKLGELKKVERKSATLGAPPPDGAIVLFDGTNTDKWNHGKIVEDHLLGVGPYSKQSFGDCTLHVEFRNPFMPTARGQARGNSGVYMQNRYEIQVLDSFGLEGNDDDCGGIYKIAKEKVCMSFPPLSWQTYDIDFTAARFDADGKKTSNAKITVKHNGVVVHENLELPHATPGQITTEQVAKGDTVLKGPLYLQDHAGDPCAFQNVWIVEKK